MDANVKRVYSPSSSAVAVACVSVAAELRATLSSFFDFQLKSVIGATAPLSASSFVKNIAQPPWID
eukprot:8860278-Prorocentrum_lima.AAC.1